jgi:transposase
MTNSSDNPPFALGIDVGKADAHVALLDPANAALLAEAVFANDKKGFAALLRWLGKTLPKGASVHACMEATGSYSQPLALCLHEHLAAVSVVNPQAIKAFGQIKLRRSKTDPADARLIARFCLKERPELWKAPGAVQQKLAALVRRVANLQQQQTAENNRLGQCLDADASKSLRSHLRWLKAEQKRLQTQIERLTTSEPELKKKALLLQSIPGIGVKSAAALLAELPHLESFGSARQLAAYAGLTPRHHQSGTSGSKRTPLCKIGSNRLRLILFFPAIAAMRFNPQTRAFTQRLLERGKPKLVVIGALMRKLIHIVYGVLKHQKNFNPHHLLPSALPV